MTPQIKAYEIWQKMMNADILVDSVSAKQCALVAVDEIVEAVKFLHYGVEYINVRDYWAEVKEELEKL